MLVDNYTRCRRFLVLLFLYILFCAVTQLSGLVIYWTHVTDCCKCFPLFCFRSSQTYDILGAFWNVVLGDLDECHRPKHDQVRKLFFIFQVLPELWPRSYSLLANRPVRIYYFIESFFNFYFYFLEKKTFCCDLCFNQHLFFQLAHIVTHCYYTIFDFIK